MGKKRKESPAVPSVQVEAGGRVRKGHVKRNLGGRPTVLTEGVKGVLLAAIAKGMAFDHSAELAGISSRTFCHWRRLGRMDEEAGNDTEYSALLRSIKGARARFVEEALERISLAGRAQWQAAAWTLERLFPEHFASDRLELRRIVKEMVELQKKLAELQAKK